VPVSVFVFGSGFDLAPGGTSVAFNGNPQPIVATVTTDMLIVRAFNPTVADSGPVTVTTSAGAVECPMPLEVTP
jgi:alanine racemase